MDVKENYHKHRVQIECYDTGNYERDCRSSLRGTPAEAVYGLSSAFYYLFAAIVFLIPAAMVAARLRAMFADKQGGVFR